MPVLAEFELETITHALIGGYDASPYSTELGIYELPRTQALKGMWRWWFRALVGGALWEAGWRNREGLEGRIREEVKRILGSTKQASRLLLNIQISKGHDDLFTRFQRPPRNLPPRIALLQMGLPQEIGAARISCFEPGLKFTITVVKRPHARLTELEERVALWSLALFLTLGGIGMATRRGFGALKVNRINKVVYRDIARKIRKLNEASEVEGAKKALKDIIENSLNSARDFLGVSRSKGGRELPPFPVLTHPASTPFRLDVCQIDPQCGADQPGFRDPEAIALLRKLGEATLTQSWREKNSGGKNGEYRTWILGLPRGGRYKYKPRRRRASAIYLRPLKRLSRTWLVAIYGFVSKDWPSEIKYRGEPESPSQYVERAFDQAWSTIKRILTCGVS